MRVGLWGLTAALISSVVFAAGQAERNRSLSERSVNWTKHPATQCHATATADPRIDPAQVLKMN
jgi:hypothetical protein